MVSAKKGFGSPSPWMILEAFWELPEGGPIKMTIALGFCSALNDLYSGFEACNGFFVSSLGPRLMASITWQESQFIGDEVMSSPWPNCAEGDRQVVPWRKPLYLGVPLLLPILRTGWTWLCLQPFSGGVLRENDPLRSWGIHCMKRINFCASRMVLCRSLGWFWHLTHFFFEGLILCCTPGWERPSHVYHRGDVDLLWLVEVGRDPPELLCPNSATACTSSWSAEPGAS